MITQNSLLKGIYLDKKPDTPKISLNTELGILEISGRSLPENAEIFYQPLLDWVDNYMKTDPAKTVLKIDLEYFNSSSVKQVLAILIKLEELFRSGKEVQVVWHYNKDDELMEMKGRELESIVELPFNLVAYTL